jgi:hypothetical protein
MPEVPRLPLTGGTGSNEPAFSRPAGRARIAFAVLAPAAINTAITIPALWLTEHPFGIWAVGRDVVYLMSVGLVVLAVVAAMALFLLPALLT